MQKYPQNNNNLKQKTPQMDRQNFIEDSEIIKIRITPESSVITFVHNYRIKITDNYRILSKWLRPEWRPESIPEKIISCRSVAVC